MGYEAVIGLEIHVQMNCTTKMFCECSNSPGDEPNKNICPVCLWLPGALPKFSEEALGKATLICLALNCKIQEESAFDQKVYYYPDLPKGYQLSQHHKPLSRSGWLDILDEDGKPKKLSIHHIHMEEDVARLVHEVEGRTPVSLVDFNRAGTPLVEIVTEPDMRSPYDAMEFLKALRTQIRYTGSAECSMEQGTMRVDANISIRSRGSNQLNTKVEVKNMNSIRHVGDAIAYEIKRQESSLKSGEPIVLHTRLWNPEKRITEAMRGKAEGPCVPDPSVPKIVVTESWINEMKSRLPEMPSQKVKRFVDKYGLTYEEALYLCSERDVSEYFEKVLNNKVQPRTVAHWMATHVLPSLKERDESISETTLTPERLAGLLIMLDSDEVNTNAAKEVLNRLFESDLAPEEIVEQYGFKQVSDVSELEFLVNDVLAANQSAVADFKNGKPKAMGFLIGQTMKASQGKANPKIIQKMLNEKLG